MLDELLREGDRLLAETGMGFTGVGPGSGNAARLTREYFDALQIEMRVIDAVEASTRAVFFGVEFATPVMVAALSSLDRVRPGGMIEVARGAAAAGAAVWVGIGGEDELKAVVDAGAKAVKIVKPYREHDTVLRKLEAAERCGAVAVGMDVSFAMGMKNGFAPASMSPKSLDDLKLFIRSTKLPFVVKGVLSEQDARKAVAAGAAAAVVSHQGGTVLDFAVPPAKILPRIAAAVDKRLAVFADCGIASGMDAFKAMALGADGVCVGKAVVAGLAVAGADGVRRVLEGVTAQLRRTMSLTGAAGVHDIDPSVIWR